MLEPISHEHGVVEGSKGQEHIWVLLLRLKSQRMPEFNTVPFTADEQDSSARSGFSEENYPRLGDRRSQGHPPKCLCLGLNQHSLWIETVGITWLKPPWKMIRNCVRSTGLDSIRKLLNVCMGTGLKWLDGNHLNKRLHATFPLFSSTSSIRILHVRVILRTIVLLRC